MKIRKDKLTLKVPYNKYLPSIQDEIRQNLSRMGVDGLSIDIRYDIRTNVAFVRFMFKGKHYEMKVNNQMDIRSNMWALNKRIEYKARMHLLEIESFDVSVSPYLQLDNLSGVNTNFEMPKATAKSYAILGIPEYTSNADIDKKYKQLAKTFHPDMALSEDAKKEFEKRFAEINQAYDEIKKERCI
jgi:DnaJ-domain-containing protein 1